MTGTRCSTAGELAHVYATLARSHPDLDVCSPAVILVGVHLDQSVIDRLNRFGVDVRSVDEPAAAPRIHLLGGELHGTVLPGDGPDPGATLAGLVEHARLRQWAGGVGPEPAFTTMHKPGSDSRGVVQFRLGEREVVAKIGVRDAIAGEVRFASTVNDLLAREDRPALFPQVHGLQVEGGQAVSLMEAGRPMPIGPLFTDPQRTVLDPAALDMLEPHLDLVGAWYRLTARERRPTVADYLYRERYHVLRDTPAFVDTFRSLFGGVDPDALFAAPVRLPGGAVVPGWTEAVAWLDATTPRLLTDRGSAVHGDIYAANMLLRGDGSPMLIDPRTVWEGRDRPDVGYGDPVYDLATLLHGVFPMAAVLHAVETGTTDTLFTDEVRTDQDKLDLSSLRLPVTPPPAVRALEQRMLRALPYPDEHAPVRLYIGAATSLAGWLKYAKSLRTPQAWLATYAFVAWYLAQARSRWEEAIGTDGKQAS